MSYEGLTIDLASAASGCFEAKMAVAPIAGHRTVPLAKPVANDKRKDWE